MQKKHPAVISCLFSQCLFNLNSPHLNVTFSCCVIWKQNCVGVILKGLGWDSRPNISGQFANWRLSELHKLSHRRWALQICSLLLGTFSLNFSLYGHLIFTLNATAEIWSFFRQIGTQVHIAQHHNLKLHRDNPMSCLAGSDLKCFHLISEPRKTLFI